MDPRLVRNLYMVKDNLELLISSAFTPQCAGIRGVHHHVLFRWGWGLNPVLHGFEVNSLPAKLSPQSPTDSCMTKKQFSVLT